MVSKSQIKLITSLQQKKYRNQHKLFIAEGIKVINALLQSHFTLNCLFTTTEDLFFTGDRPVQYITEKQLHRISNLATPNKALALFQIPAPLPLALHDITIALDDVRDPGNLGTLIRLCDWFGVRNIVCSKKTADCYNPKVVQASMGSLARVHVLYTDLTAFLSKTEIPAITADTKGKSVYATKLPEKAILVMGNEANGVSEAVMKLSRERLSIPNFSHLQEAESLNVAVATAILLSEFKRKNDLK